MELRAPAAEGGVLASAVAALAERGAWREPQERGPRERAVAYLVGRLAAEMRALDELVMRSRDCLAIEERGLSETLAGIARQARAADAARTAAEALGRTASAVATHASELSLMHDRLPGAIDAAVKTMHEVEAGTVAIREGLRSGEQVATHLRDGWHGAGDAVGGIARAARQASVLGMSAAIEAAYVSEGHGFAIVADRVRQLAASTLEASQGVSAIVMAARRSAGEAFDVIARVGTFMDGIVSRIAPARASLGGAHARVAAFGDALLRVSTLAEEQNVALPGVVEGLGRLSELAAIIAKRAGTELRAEIAVRLGAATAVLAHHAGLIAVTPVSPPEPGDDALAAWIVALAGDDTTAPPAHGGGDRALCDAIAGLLDRVVRDQRTIVESMASATRSAVGTGVLWRLTRREMRSFDTEMTQLAAGLDESQGRAASFVAAFAAIATELDAVQDLCSSALVAFDEALDRVESGHEHGAQAAAAIGAMHGATERATALLSLVAEVSDEAHLLALNAAVEAARAGTRGAGFTVIADEIGRLAAATQESTDAIVATMTRLRAQSGEFVGASDDRMRALARVRAQAGEARDVVEQVRLTIGTSLAGSAAIREAAAGVAASLESVGGDLVIARDEARSISVRETERARLVLGRIDNEALHVTAAHRLGLAEETLRDFTYELTLQVEDAMRRLVEDGRVTIAALTALEYRELAGPLVDRFERLAGATGLPREGMRPPRYTTPSDRLVDEAVIPLLNAAMQRNERLVISALFDLNGFGIALATLTRGRDGELLPLDWKTWGGKMILTDLMTLRAGRLGIPDSDALPERLTAASVKELGLDLRAQDPRPWQYSTCVNWATKEVCRGASWPVHVGGVRVAVVTCMESIER
jgi:methyl-accepting chemotaxis protein